VKIDDLVEIYKKLNNKIMDRYIKLRIILVCLLTTILLGAQVEKVFSQTNIPVTVELVKCYNKIIDSEIPVFNKIRKAFGESIKHNTILVIGSNLICTSTITGFSLLLLKQKPGVSRTYFVWTTSNVNKKALIINQYQNLIR
jgi:hypothetical protein